MDFALSEERRLLAETAERFLRDHYPLETRHDNAAKPEGFCREAWKAFADLGLIAALLPPAVDGLGGDGEDILVVFEALGSRLVVEPFLAGAVLGATPILLSGSPSQQAMLQDVISGDLLLAFAHGEKDSRYSDCEVRTKAENWDGQWYLSGQKSVVLNGDTADVLVVTARTSGEADAKDGLGLFLVKTGADGLSRRSYGTIEGGQAAEISFDDVPADPIGSPGEAYPVIEQTIAHGSLAISAEALGIMEASKNITLDYLKTRTQFGRPIGSFQNLQHRMVDMLLEIEQARSAVMLAAGTLGADRVTRERHIAAAKNLIGRVGQLVAEESIQLHGGIAMTWDYQLGHYAKRLVMLDHLLGDTDHHLERFISFSRMEDPTEGNERRPE
ncbi:MAG: acyl-CoA dehydrogenase family protein [Geminicoccaceae bacterium]